MRNRRPNWVDQLGEEIRIVPPERFPARSPIVTPTETNRARKVVPQGGGLPKILTRPIGATASPPVAPTPAPPLAHNGGGNGSVAAIQAPAEPDASEQNKPMPAAPLLVSPLESMYRGSMAKEPSRVLSQFGYEFFAREAITEDSMPLADTYIVRPGDEIVLNITGSLKGLYKLTILRDGKVNIPDVCDITVAGTKVRDLDEVIQRSIEQLANRRNFRVSVSMGKILGFPIQVVGEVRRPGIVEVSGRGTVITALAFAGGVRKTGSLRRVQIRRAGKLHATVDLYDFLLQGDTNGLEFLRADDTIVVPTIGKTLAIAGYVHRPGIYETLPTQKALTIKDALALAGGLTPFTFTPHARIERTIAGRGRGQIDVKLDEAGLARTMEDGELLLIGAVNEDGKPVIRLSGEVVRPGDYEYRPGMKVSDLLELGDGLTVDAYLPQAFLSRQIGSTGKVMLVPDRQAFRTARRILVIDLSKAYAHDPEHDLALSPLDHLEIVSHTQAADRPTVTVMGAVRRPGTYELTADLRVSHLIAIAGNVTTEVYYDEAELIRREYDPNQRQLAVKRYRFDLRKALAGKAADDFLLANHDQLVVRTLQTAQVKVEVKGDVRFPGQYVFPKGARITDLIAAAGGAMPTAELRGSIFMRKSVRTMQNQRFRHLKETTRMAYESALEQMVMRGTPPEGLATRLAVNQTRELLDRMNTYQANGRVVIPFLALDFPRTEHNLTLEDGDQLFIPARQETVAIMGHVFNPASFVAENGLTVETMIQRSGGLTEDGDDQRVYVIRADGIVQSLEQNHGRLSMSTRLLPGDVVLVPRRPLTRTLGNRLADALFLLRRGAETAFILSKLGDSSNLNFSSVLNEGLGDDVNVIDNTLIKK